MRGEPVQWVLCDRCESTEEDVELTALAGGGWDDRNVKYQLKRLGWRIDGDRDICPDCVEAEER